MASQHHFTDRLRAQLNDANARNLELQALLAQRDDTLAACNARLQNVLSASSTTGDPNIVLLQDELRLAKEATINAENRLSQTFTVFDQERSEWKQRIEKLQREVAVRDSVLRDASHCLEKEASHSTTIDSLQAQLANTQAELKRTKQYATGIQKQFEAEKKENSKLRAFPTTAMGKSRTDIDQDDEEVVDDATRIKQETMSGARRQNSGAPSSMLKSHKAQYAPNLSYRSLPTMVTKPRSQAKRSKRKRSSVDHFDADYDDLEIDMDDSGGLTAQPPMRGMEIEHMKQTCDFKAVVSYDQDGDKLYLDSKQDLSDVCPELWERIQNQHEAWEQACGEEWRYDLESKYTVSALAKPGAKPPCVTTKLLKISCGKTTWREGCEGKYACLGCVREKRPCFSWDGEELYLLPLHVEDRTLPVEEGFEIRTWLDID